tara:strand:- start:58 stop:306 length:249 start_codon:yes stop_codon:yes gene_type:complete
MKFIKDYQALIGFVIVAVMVGYTHLESEEEAKEYRTLIVTDRIEKNKRESMRDDLYFNRFDEIHAELEFIKDEVAQIREKVL